ncbi:MAG TPA: SDR family NAD(P)-dependent oxidoreductase, partial [Longimicrobiales bacterium]
MRVAEPDRDGAAVEQLLAEVGEETRPEVLRSHADLRGHGAIVTGGATGIGRAIVLELARHGVHVAFNYVDDRDGATRREAEATLAQVRQLEVTGLCRMCDVRDVVAVERFVAETVDAFGSVHILVNNAGI